MTALKYLVRSFFVNNWNIWQHFNLSAIMNECLSDVLGPFLQSLSGYFTLDQSVWRTDTAVSKDPPWAGIAEMHRFNSDLSEMSRVTEVQTKPMNKWQSHSPQCKKKMEQRRRWRQRKEMMMERWKYWWFEGMTTEGADSIDAKDEWEWTEESRR